MSMENYNFWASTSAENFQKFREHFQAQEAKWSILIVNLGQKINFKTKEIANTSR